MLSQAGACIETGKNHIGSSVPGDMLNRQENDAGQLQIGPTHVIFRESLIVKSGKKACQSQYMSRISILVALLAR